MRVDRPYQHYSKWHVEINYYPESRCIETWEFDTQDDALEFYRKNTQPTKSKGGSPDV